MRDDRSDETSPFARLERTDAPMDQTTCHARGGETPALDDTARRGDALDAIDDVVAFFERAAARHHDDEEQSLFPALRERPSWPRIPAACDSTSTASTIASSRSCAPR